MNESHTSQKILDFFSKYKKLDYKKGETLIHGEDEPQGIYYLTKGYVRMFLITPDGKELTLNIFKPSSYFPMIWAIADIPNAYYYEAITAIEVIRAPKSDVLTKLVTNDQEVLFELTRRIMVGMDGLLTRIQYLLTADAHQRVVSVMIMLAKRFGERKKDKIFIDIPFTHQEIANLAGLTRETTSLELTKLNDKKLIYRKGKIWVVNGIDKLVEESLIFFNENSLTNTF